MFHNKERGDGEGTIVILAFLLCMGAIVWGIISYNSQAHRFNQFAEECRASNGVVQTTYKDWHSERFDCYKDGKLIKVPAGDY